MVPLALGSQTNGSVIRPAAFCGVYGFKPTHGLIPRTGILKLSRLLDHIRRDVEPGRSHRARREVARDLGRAAADIQTEITHLVERAASTLKFRPTLEIEGPLRSTVSDEVAPHLLAVLGETLSNAIRHSGATEIGVRVSAGDSLELVVSDNGGGIIRENPESGLRNIRDRAVRLGGMCEVMSSPDGTTVTWSVPFS
jgi:signal transduction histidine kinase